MKANEIVQSLVDSLLQGGDRHMAQDCLTRVLRDPELPEEARTSIANAIYNSRQGMGDNLRLLAADYA